MPMGISARAGRDIVVSGTLSDAHTWNLVFLELLLRERGHRVTNLGSCVPDALLVAECRRRRPDLVVVSSVNGHGFQDGRRMISEIRGCVDLERTPVVIGGKLGIGGADDGSRETILRAAGFNRVFEEGATGLPEFLDYLESLESEVLL
ncbi:methylaspartate mutase sigma subunit [Actinacidiphila rubida]|uniref:Methylaspartate mutase sigma subunit n=2 Tax=Actinacidiphila rubida TaxID=310780 RepID=A0A1H8KA34_9ACTN|nr:methylaspartate mutase sigma subunit [Actinacidiphila rubida]